MKKYLLILVGATLFALPQWVLSNTGKVLQQRCEQQAQQDDVDASLLDDYLLDCIRYYQAIEPEQPETFPEAEEQSEATASTPE